MMSSSHIPQHQVVQSPANPGLGGHNSVPKQRLKSATMNKRIQRGFSRENTADDQNQYDDTSHGNQQQYHGYTGHLSNAGMPAVGGASQYAANAPNTRQSKTSSGARNQTWKNQQQIY